MFERSRGVEVTFPPHTTTVLELKLAENGIPYWSRPDLGISSEDVKIDHNRMNVTVHSLEQRRCPGGEGSASRPGRESLGNSKRRPP